MKYKLLAVSSENELNIGDYIQALASAQFLPQIDGFIQREELKDYDSEECKVIMNGWYMHHPEQWPPSDKIHPLFVAFHINSLAKEQLLSQESLDYLKKYEPIGCRDAYTRDLLIEKGVNAYFSGCMTLTLGYTYKSKRREDKCYFVDPFVYREDKLFKKIQNLLYLLCHWKSATTIADKWPGSCSRLRKRISVSYFLQQYRKIFTKDTLLKAEYISQQNMEYKSSFKTDSERLDEASRLINKYACARLVVTSRIHCALPCLGLDTPVIFTERTSQSESSACRLHGLKEFFNILSIDKHGLKTDFHHNEKISISTAPSNKYIWKEYAIKLERVCLNFINSNVE